MSQQTQSSACSRGTLSASATPSSSGPLDAQTTAVYDVVVANGDAGPCDARLLIFVPGAVPSPGFSGFVDPAETVLAAGQNAHFTLSVTANTDVPAGTYALPFSIEDPNSGDTATGEVAYELLPAGACAVRPNRELLMTDSSVVDDPVRTTFDGELEDTRTGAWTFGRLMTQMAKHEEDAPRLVETLFESWLTDQTVNTFTVRARPQMQSVLLDAWPRRANGTLDLTRAPFRLLAIVNRLDARGRLHGPAGEVRFVFGILDAGGFAQPFTLILEYRVPVTTDEEVLAWARDWHALGSLPFPSETYNAALQAIADRVVRRGANPSGVNRSAIAAIRTNEIALEFPWELRQFRLSFEDGLFHETEVELTPDTGFISGSPVVADFVNENEAAILRGEYVVPIRFEGQPFLGGSSVNELTPWTAPGIRNPDARHAFALNACNGCHSVETLTGFLHISPRDAGSATTLSRFLLGMAVPDPVTGELRILNDLQRRQLDLEHLVCECGANTGCPFLHERFSRTH